MIKYYKQSNLGKKGFILTHDSKGTVHHGRQKQFREDRINLAQESRGIVHCGREGKTMIREDPEAGAEAD